jgi:NAD(P)-dependent dehydrogenase (short-subunit alcohol dehydrogenase family)
MTKQATRTERPIAIVTGGSRGIGRGIVERLAADGWGVVINYFSRRDAADELAGQISAAGGDALVVQADIGNSADRLRLVNEALQHFGRIDLLVNNAGITSPGRKDLLEATEEGWDQVFDTNLKGPFFLAQQVARAMTGLVAGGAIPGGTIINISSISAFAVSTNRADYCIAKSALQMLTWLLATRLADERIRVYEVCPGVIASDMTAPVQEKYDKLIEGGLSPIRRWGQPGDVAAAVSMLAGGALPFSTGERIHVDGGFHIRRL